jgi:tRNA dimethylallyltransferase
MGPTASGKSALAMELVQRLPCDIIRVDSALVYRGMDIGTAKPTAAELALAPHRLIDLLDPTQAYSAADFCRDALREMPPSRRRDGSRCWWGAQCSTTRPCSRGLSPLPEADPLIRAQIEAEAQALGWAELHQQLLQIDPVAGARIHPNDPQRLSRALEVFRITGKSMNGADPAVGE